MTAMRWAALAIMLVVLVIAGIFVGAVVWPPPPPPMATADGRFEVAAPGARRLTGRAGGWTVTAEIVEGAGGAVEIVVAITDVEGRPAAPAGRPQAVLRMVDMAMGAQPVSLQKDASGRWRGAGRLSMGGRWSLQVEIDGARATLPFEARSP